MHHGSVVGVGGGGIHVPCGDIAMLRSRRYTPPRPSQPPRPPANDKPATSSPTTPCLAASCYIRASNTIISNKTIRQGWLNGQSLQFAQKNKLPQTKAQRFNSLPGPTESRFLSNHHAHRAVHRGPFERR